MGSLIHSHDCDIMIEMRSDFHSHMEAIVSRDMTRVIIELF
jgi:hypothetical protein